MLVLHLELTVSEPDGSNPSESLIYFDLIDVNEIPKFGLYTQDYCIEEMVGNSFAQCADKTARDPNNNNLVYDV